MRNRRSLVVLACVAACGDRPSMAPVQRTDSAGVHVVQVQALPPLDEVESVGGPTVMIRGPVSSMGDMRISAGGDLLVPDRMSPVSLLEFRRDGELQARVGRDGQGPGEFRSITAAVELDDGSTLVLDAWQGRWTRFGPDGELEMGSYPTSIGSPVAAASNEWVLFMRTPLTAPAPLGRVDLQTTYHLWNPSSEESTAVPVSVPVQAHYSNADGMVVRMEIPWEAVSHAALNDSYVAVTLPLSEEVRVFATSGALVTVIRFDEALDPVAEGEWRDWVEWHIARVPEEWQQRERARLRDVPRPRTSRTLGRIILDDDNRLWVERYSPPHEGLAVWDVFSHDGLWLRSFRFPDGFRGHDVRGDFVLGELRSELGVSAAIGWDLVF